MPHSRRPVVVPAPILVPALDGRCLIALVRKRGICDVSRGVLCLLPSHGPWFLVAGERGRQRRTGEVKEQWPPNPGCFLGGEWMRLEPSSSNGNMLIPSDNTEPSSPLHKLLSEAQMFRSSRCTSGGVSDKESQKIRTQHCSPELLRVTLNPHSEAGTFFGGAPLSSCYPSLSEEPDGLPCFRRLAGAGPVIMEPGIVNGGQGGLVRSAVANMLLHLHRQQRDTVPSQILSVRGAPWPRANNEHKRRRRTGIDGNMITCRLHVTKTSDEHQRVWPLGRHESSLIPLPSRIDWLAA
ncbi:unnamed protein product [Pleuronectes platessa]|uniref:Uncharacterized protein n=1 Tax=Pleuronectes platessa TaxID=8262 RepID=A0A9N7VN17_PLEPL|nr:unnamed protein product [Pleuronectes platessa]